MRVRELVQRFPRLADGHFRITSPRDYRYNCIAWAAAEDHRWWHPSAFPPLHWPDAYPREDTLAGWIAAFETLGFHECSSSQPEPGTEKVALYAWSEFPLHVARQLPGGRWTSKLGTMEDIEHDLEGLAGSAYGYVVVILARPLR